MSKLIIVPKSMKKTRKARQTTKVVKVSIGKVRKSSSRPQLSGASSFLRSYTCSLNDPFEYPGVPLGYDCYLPSSLFTAYKRGSFVVDAVSGSFSIVMMPDIINFVSPSSAAIATARGSTYLSADNATSIATQFAECRVISGGLRMFALFPETSAPGVLFSGSAVDQSSNSWAGFATNNIRDLAGSHLGIGTKGASATIRPYDNGSFEFFTFPISGYSATTIPYMTSVYMAGQGFPVGTTIWYEAILNLEGLSKTSSFSTGTPVDESATPTGSTWFPTPGSLFTAAQNYLSPQIIMDASMAALQASSGNYAGAARSLSRIGSGSNVRNAWAQRQGRENSVVIEEMKDDAMGFVGVSRSRLR